MVIDISFFEPIRVAIATFLQTIIVSNEYIYLDYWSIVHLFSGIMIMTWLIRSDTKKPYFILFIALVVYEIIEYAFIIMESPYFRGETNIDIISDVVVGMVGGFIAERLSSK